MRLFNIIRSWKMAMQSSGGRLLRIRINKKQLLKNVDAIKRVAGERAVGAVLKSNAYGHGLKEMGAFLDTLGEINYFFVDSIIEAGALRDTGVTKPIIILGYIPSGAIERLKKYNNIIVAINSLRQARMFAERVAFSLKVHIKVDTGMHRQGIEADKLTEAIRVLLGNRHIHVEGMFTHCSDADNDDNSYTRKQLIAWGQAMEQYRRLVSSDGVFHFAATASMQYLNEAESNLVRAGIGLYGFDITPRRILGVKPILSLWAKIANIKPLVKGESIGYGATYRAKHYMRVLTIPCGYYEGVPRALSNKGCVYYGKYRLPMIGRVSMNMISVDGTDIKEQIEIEDEVEVISDNLEHDNNVNHIALLCDTIPYEIVTNLSPYIHRTIK